MSEENMAVKPEGKGMGTAGFVISLVGLLGASIVMGISVLSVAAGGGAGLSYFWLVLCIAGLALSVMGMMKLGKTGGKKGLSIAGMIIGIVATIWMVFGIMGLTALESVEDQFGDEFRDQLEQSMDEAFDEAMEDLDEEH